MAQLVLLWHTYFCYSTVTAVVAHLHLLWHTYVCSGTVVSGVAQSRLLCTIAQGLLCTHASHEIVDCLIIWVVVHQSLGCNTTYSTTGRDMFATVSQVLQ